MGDNRFAPFATALYAAVLALAGISFVPMPLAVTAQLEDEPSYRPVGRRVLTKNVASISIYAAGVPLAFVHPAITVALAFLVSASYFLPSVWLGEESAGGHS